MIRPLNRRERQAYYAENPSMVSDQGASYRVAIALDRENQPSAEARERVVVYTAALARYGRAMGATR